jgi:glycine/D-amino acid oxidase-like deaminating enzyme
VSGASVVIVGAGVMGASVAYHLAARGATDVLLLDRASGPGLGSTGAATGGFRAQFATAINVRLSLLAREKLLRFRDEVGADPGYVAAGYLWLAESEADLAALKAGLQVQHAAGLSEASEIGADDVARWNPAIVHSGIVGGAHCPTDGFIRPVQILEGYLAAARRLGARVRWGHEVSGIERAADGTIRRLVTQRGPIAAEIVVNAAGAWAAGVARLAGVDLPVVPLRRQIAVTAPFDLLPETMPMTIFAGDGFHLRVRDGRVLLLWPSPGVPGRPFDASVDPGWIDAVFALARQRVPVLRRATVDGGSCRAGLYEMSPDKHALLGPAPGSANFYLINGSSGHGVMHAPALGQLLAEIITEGAARSLDVAALRPSRFSEGAANPVSELL